MKTPQRICRLAMLILTFMAIPGGCSACGISWDLPRTPFAGEQSYKFRYWESIGDATLPKDGNKGEVRIPLHIGFNLISSAASPILGHGWTFSLFDSTLIQTDDSTFLLKLPDGFEETLVKTKDVNVLKGLGWLAEVKGRIVVCKASCGWQLSYRAGKLYQMRDPNGIVFDFIQEENGG